MRGGGAGVAGTLLLLAPLLAGCAAPLEGPRTLVLATTTSTDNTGLLPHLLPDFEHRHGAAVKVVAVGTGRALELGRLGDADVVLAHAPPTERTYLRNGSFVARHEVFYNQFLLVGPPGDPAGTAGAATITDALLRLRERGAPFVSRGDLSGTHLRERELWAEAGLDYDRDVAVPANGWYRSVGQGMEATLRIAAEQGAYTLSDDGTFHKVALPSLAVARANDPPLRNQYSVLVPARSHAPALAEAFAAWLTAPETQAKVGAFAVHGHTLFTPNAAVVERPSQPSSRPGAALATFIAPRPLGGAWSWAPPSAAPIPWRSWCGSPS